MFLKVILMKDFVKNNQINKAIDAIICLKKAIEMGGSSFSKILVLIKEYPQKMTERHIKSIGSSLSFIFLFSIFIITHQNTFFCRLIIPLPKERRKKPLNLLLVIYKCILFDNTYTAII